MKIPKFAIIQITLKSEVVAWCDEIETAETTLSLLKLRNPDSAVYFKTVDIDKEIR